MVNKFVADRFIIDCFHTAFKFSYARDFIFKGERHDFWEATLVKSGKVGVTEDENIFTLGAGEMIIHAPSEFHRLWSADETEPEGYTFSFHTEGELPPELKGGLFNLDAREMSELDAIMERLIPFVAGEDVDTHTPQLVADMLSVFLIKLSRKASSSIRLNSDSAKEYRKVVRLMEDSLHENLTLRDFATRRNISISYLKLLFNMYAGVSPKAYYDTLRANEAIRLLKSGHSVNTVSDMMSFSSPNYFSVFFKRHFGLPPHKHIASGL